MPNFSEELNRISKRCNIPLDKLEVQQNSAYGHKLLVDGRAVSLLSHGKGKAFTNYLDGIVDGCDLKK